MARRNVAGRLPRVLAVAALAVVACGSSEGALADKSPDEIIDLAAAGINQGSLRYDGDGTYGVDLSGVRGLSPRDLASVAGALATSHAFSVRGEQESPQRIGSLFTIGGTPAATVPVVVYDGRTYAAVDGRRYAPASGLTSLTGLLSVAPGDVRSYLHGSGSLDDAGTEQTDGAAAEHVHGGFDQSSLNRMFGENRGLAGLLEQFMQVQGGGVDAWVRQSDGKLLRAHLVADLRANLDVLGSALGPVGTPGATGPGPRPGGTARIRVDLRLHYFDYGAAIRVTRPVPDPSAPTLAPAGGLVGG